MNIYQTAWMTNANGLQWINIGASSNEGVKLGCGAAGIKLWLSWVHVASLPLIQKHLAKYSTSSGESAKNYYAYSGWCHESTYQVWCRYVSVSNYSVGIIAFLVVKRHQIFNTAESWLVGVIELRLIQGFQRYLIWEKLGMLGRVTQIQFRPIGGDLSAKWLHFRPYFDQLVALNE